MLDPVTHRLTGGDGVPPPVAVMYHAVVPGVQTPEWPWAVSIAQFRSHLDCLVELRYSTLTVSDLVGVGNGTRTIALTFDDGYADNVAAAAELARHGMRATWFVVSGSLGREPAWPDPGRPQGRLLNAAELRSMHAAGMEIGSHSMSHARLTALGDASLRRELTASKAMLEDVIGEEVVSFAYPYGDYDVRCEAAVREAGYRLACTTATGWAIRDANPYRLRRLTVFNSDDVGRFARKLALGSHDVSWTNVARYFWRRLAGRLRDIR